LEDLTFGEIASWVGLICLLIASFWDILAWKKRKKEGTYEVVPKASGWKQSYLWQVFFVRAWYRPISATFAWVVFLAPAAFMVFFYSIGLTQGHPLKLEEMHKVSGVVTKVGYKGKKDYIRLRDENGNEDEYRLCCFYYDEEAEEFKKKIQDTKTRVDIWYEDQRYLWETYNLLRELKVENEFVKLQSGNYIAEYDYEYKVEFYNSKLPNLLWWLIYSLPGWAWLWWFNRKELPIHRLNRMKRYKKYNLKDEK